MFLETKYCVSRTVVEELGKGNEVLRCMRRNKKTSKYGHAN